MDDQAIIELYLSRDEDAIRRTEEKYSRYLTAIAQNILNDREDSRECVNDTYFRAWNTIPPHLPQRLAYYLARITRGLSIDRLRKKTGKRRGGTQYELSLEELEECVPAGSDPARETETKLLARSIGAYLRECGEEARNVFLWRYYFCDSIRDIAKRCGAGESKIKSLLYRTRAGLREHLEREGFSV